MTAQIRIAEQHELEEFAEWAEREGWQPGVGDIHAFCQVDPEGFWVAVDGDRLVGMMSGVRYDGDFSFLGFYIVAPDRRGQGLGHRLFDEVIAQRGDRLMGLDGVPDQISSYEQNGFRLSNWTPRWSGTARQVIDTLSSSVSDPTLQVQHVTSHSSSLENLIAFDALHVPARRDTFVRAWLQPDSVRVGFTALREDEIVGYAVVRPTQPDGARIGPLFADDEATARALLAACATQALDWPGPFSIDVPEPNAAATALMEICGMTISFTCARMYRGDAPKLPFERIYGSTTYELG
jgi:GNAT superfamily N-acetyltransferase